MKRVVILAMVAMGCASLAQAQEKTGEEQFIIYKWYQKGIAHYAKVPPRGVTNYVRINEHGLVITERPDIESSGTLRPIRPVSAQGESAAPITPVTPGSQPPAAAATSQTQEAPPPGTITREQRCQTAQNDLNVMNTKKSIFEEDANGNLIPLDAAAIESRKAQAQQDIASFCN